MVHRVTKAVSSRYDPHLTTKGLSLNADERITADLDTLLASFAAELTNAAYAIALRHGIEDSWVDLELDLWRVLAETVKNWGAEIASGRTEAALNARAAICREESTYANRENHAHRRPGRVT
jgi:hypothetical protein